MSRKIIGVTVGSSLPKPNFKQDDPTKGDYIRNKPDFDGLENRVDTVSGLVGDTAVSQQINDAIDGYIINVDYESTLAFDTSEIVFGSTTSSVLGQAILGQMVLA